MSERDLSYPVGKRIYLCTRGEVTNYICQCQYNGNHKADTLEICGLIVALFAIVGSCGGVATFNSRRPCNT